MNTVKRFEVPEIKNKTVTKNTLKIYKGRLNILAKLGISTIEKLVEKHEKVFEIIEYLKENNTDARLYYSACFYVLADNPNEDRLPFYYSVQKYQVPDKK